MEGGLGLAGLLEQCSRSAGEINVGRIALDGFAEHFGGEIGVGRGGIFASQAKIQRNQNQIEI